MNTNIGPDHPNRGQITSFWVLGARLTWLLIGPLALVITTLGIVSSGTGWLTGLDAGFAVAAGVMLFGRWVEYRSGTATTAAGEPATSAQLKRYVAILIPSATALWVAANLLGNHVLK